jgi:PTS system galactitol-specific IIC component
MVNNAHVNLPYIDVGWGAAAAIAFASKVGLFVIPFAIVVNLIAFALRLTDTLNIDVWNYWHYAFAGALTLAFTGSMWLAFLAAGILELYSLLFADWAQPSVQKYYGYEGISFTTISCVEYIPFAIVMNWILDKIGIGKIHLEVGVIQRKLKFFGEPAFLGLLIGLGIGFLAYSHSLNTFQSWITILLDGIATAAFVKIFPSVPALLMEGLIPISNSLRDRLNRRKSTRTVFLGMDTALAVGEPANVISGVIMIPIVILLMVVLRFNKFLFIADLAPYCFLFVLITPITHGNVLKNVIIFTLYMVAGMFIITKLTPLFTQVAISTGTKLPAGVVGIGAGGEGISYIYSVVYRAMGNPITILLLVLVYAAGIWALKHHRNAMYRAAGYVADSPESNVLVKISESGESVESPESGESVKTSESNKS